MATVQPIIPAVDRRSELLDAVDKVSSQLTSAAAILNSVFWHYADLTDTPALGQKDVATLLSTARDLVLQPDGTEVRS